jgi:hypothetical protein
MSELVLINIKELKQLITNTDIGLLFCFGTSMISKLIQARTRRNNYEKVPSHVALVYKGYIYESTTEVVHVNNKTIPAGVRRWQLKDYFKAESKKETEYYFSPILIDSVELEKYVHYPYGKDTIIDFLLENGSDGVSKGLICSQYANKVTHLLDKECPCPAEMFRHCRKLEELK